MREAFAEYNNAKKSQTEEQSRSFMAMAIRKTQLALQYSLGSPEYLELLVADAIQSQVTNHDPRLRLLSTLASIAKILLESQIPWKREITEKVATEAIQGASEIIREVTSEKNLEPD